MSRLDKLVKELNQETTTPEPTKNSEDSSATDINNASSNLAVNDDKKIDGPLDTDVKDATKTSTVDDSGYKKQDLTTQQKQEYAFRKEFGKQEKKFQQMLAERDKVWESRLVATKPIAPEVKITEDNFESKEAYDVWKEEQLEQKILERLQKQSESQSQQSKELNERTTAIKTRVTELYKDPEELKLYEDMVNHAISEGLDQYLDSENDMVIKKFIEKSSIGPKVLQHLIGYPELLKSIYNMDDNLDKKVELKLLEKELQYDMRRQSLSPTNINKDVNVPTIKPIPVLGKLGSNSSNGSSNLNGKEEFQQMLNKIRGK